MRGEGGEKFWSGLEDGGAADDQRKTSGSFCRERNAPRAAAEKKNSRWLRPAGLPDPPVWRGPGHARSAGTPDMAATSATVAELATEKRTWSPAVLRFLPCQPRNSPTTTGPATTANRSSKLHPEIFKEAFGQRSYVHTALQTGARRRIFKLSVWPAMQLGMIGKLL